MALPLLLLSRPGKPSNVLRITMVSSGGRTTLALEGRVAGQWVEELSRAADEARRHAGGIAVDLSQVTFVDAPGAVLLRTLAAGGVDLERGSEFVSGLIRGGQA